MTAVLREDVVLHSPILFRGFEGREMVGQVLTHVAATLEDFAYTDEIAGEDTVCLRFKAKVGDRELEGIDFLELDDDGKVTELTVFMRPLSAINAFNEQMKMRLEAAQAAATRSTPLPRIRSRTTPQAVGADRAVARRCSPARTLWICLPVRIPVFPAARWVRQDSNLQAWPSIYSRAHLTALAIPQPSRQSYCCYHRRRMLPSCAFQSRARPEMLLARQRPQHRITARRTDEEYQARPGGHREESGSRLRLAASNPASPIDRGQAPSRPINLFQPLASLEQVADRTTRSRVRLSRSLELRAGTDRPQTESFIGS